MGQIGCGVRSWVSKLAAARVAEVTVVANFVLAMLVASLTQSTSNRSALINVIHLVYPCCSDGQTDGRAQDAGLMVNNQLSSLATQLVTTQISINALFLQF